jgi:hypothetical protein
MKEQLRARSADKFSAGDMRLFAGVELVALS